MDGRVEPEQVSLTSKPSHALFHILHPTLPVIPFLCSPQVPRERGPLEGPSREREEDRIAAVGAQH